MKIVKNVLTTTYNFIHRLILLISQVPQRPKDAHSSQDARDSVCQRYNQGVAHDVIVKWIVTRKSHKRTKSNSD